MRPLERVVVVGASLAGLRAAEALRREGYANALTLVGDEPHFPPYDRPPLSKEVLLGRWPPERARLRVRDELNAEIRQGCRAVGCDADGGAVLLEGGERLEFDGLVIATGARARPAPFIREGLSGVHVLRTLGDCLSLRQALRPHGSVTVIGAGWIGTEVAAACRQADVEVTVIEALDAPVARALGPAVGGWLAELHRDRGVRLELGAGVAGVVADRGAVRAVTLSDGAEIPTDALVVAIGAAPEVGWLAGSGLQLDDGVVCDASCRALGHENIVAAGDVARWFHPLFGRTLRLEHWTNAVEQAGAAAASLLASDGAAAAYAPVPYIWSDQYDTKLQFVGIAGDYAGAAEGQLGDEKFVALFAEGERLVGALCVNAPGRLRVYRRHIAAGARVADLVAA